MRRRSSFAATPSMARTSSAEIGRGIDNRLGNREQARPGTLHVAGDHQKAGCVAREAVNGGDDDTSPCARAAMSFLSCGAVGGRAGDLLTEHLFASGCLELGKLAGEVLGVGRDAGVAVNLPALCMRNLHQKSAIRDIPNGASGWRGFSSLGPNRPARQRFKTKPLIGSECRIYPYSG
jgi:hypothetical protein